MTLDKKKIYSKQRHRLSIIRMVSSPLVFILFIISGISVYLRNIAHLLSPNDYINLIGFYALISLLYYLITLPLTYHAGFVLEHRFALSNQTLKDWSRTEIKKGIVSFVIVTPFVLSLYAFIKYWPLYWWLLASLLWFFVTIFLARVTPSLIVPLFYKYSPIKRDGLRDKLLWLASKVGFKTEGVYQINMSKDTKKANAALLGLGNKKRIVLCDTLLENFNEDEIESVMAHELGHHKKRHILKLILLGGVSTVLVFLITDIIFLKVHGVMGYKYLYDFESLVLVCAIISVLNLFTLPIHNAFSRKLEQAADEFALKLTNNKAVFVSTMKKLADQNLADLDPGKFYEIMLYTHPPISRRISFAESYKARE